MIATPYILYSDTNDDATAVSPGDKTYKTSLLMTRRDDLKTIQFLNCNQYSLIDVCPVAMRIGSFLNHRDLSIPRHLKAIKIFDCKLTDKLKIDLPENRQNLIVFHVKNLSSKQGLILESIELHETDCFIWIENCEFNCENAKLRADYIYLKNVTFTGGTVTVTANGNNLVLNNVKGNILTVV